MTIHVEIERDWVRIAGQIVYRPENCVPGIWLSAWDNFGLNLNEIKEEAYEEGYNARRIEEEGDDA